MPGEVADGVDIKGDEVSAEEWFGIICGDVFHLAFRHRDEGEEKGQEGRAHGEDTLAGALNVAKSNRFEGRHRIFR